VRDVVQVGMGKAARRAYHLQEVAVVPSRRTRDVEEVSTAWQIDAFRFELPLMGHPSDATMSPRTAAELGRLGGLGVLNAEGLWCRYADPYPVYDAIVAAEEDASAQLQRVYAEPVKTELVTERIKQLREADGTVAVRISPQHTLALAPTVLAAGVDLLVIQGTIVSAEHVSEADDALNLKEFIADLDIPVVVGGCADYKTALHLMRTGAAGVIVGIGSDWCATTDEVLGIRVPMATAIADAAAARRDYLDETGGRYVHVIADGDVTTSGDIVRAIACGADAVMLGEPLRVAEEVPARGVWWDSAASHPKLPRGAVGGADSDHPYGSLEQILTGPSDSPNGRMNLFGGLRRAMAKTGYRDLKEFQKVEIVLDA
jgi:IMP dehydrogenase